MPLCFEPQRPVLDDTSLVRIFVNTDLANIRQAGMNTNPPAESWNLKAQLFVQ